MQRVRHPQGFAVISCGVGLVAHLAILVGKVYADILQLASVGGTIECVVGMMKTRHGGVALVHSLQHGVAVVPAYGLERVGVVV